MPLFKPIQDKLNQLQSFFFQVTLNEDTNFQLGFARPLKPDKNHTKKSLYKTNLNN
jgi:hypothetical protein